MAWYICEYSPWPRGTKVKSPISRYSSYIWANNLKHAERLARQRRIGEKVLGFWSDRSVGTSERISVTVPFVPPSIQLRKRRLTAPQRLDVIHAACFLGFLVARRPNAAVHGILGDEGLLHQTIHSLSHGYPRRKRLRAMLEHFERFVPGYWPHKKRAAPKRP